MQNLCPNYVLKVYYFLFFLNFIVFRDENIFKLHHFRLVGRIPVKFLPCLITCWKLSDGTKNILIGSTVQVISVV